MYEKTLLTVPRGRGYANFEFPVWGYVSKHRLVTVALEQTCTTYGPWAKCDLQKFLARAAKVFVSLPCLFDRNTLWKSNNKSFVDP